MLLRRAGIKLQAGRYDDAAADARRSLGLFDGETQSGTFSAHMGRSYLTLGRALQAQGKAEEAHAAFRAAAENLGNTLGVDNPDSRAARELSR